MIKTLLSLSPNRSTYRVLLSQSCRESDSSLSSYQKVLNFMVNNEFKPNQVDIDVAIRSLCSVRRVDYDVLLGDRLVGVLKKCGLKSDAFMYNTIMKGYCMLSKGIEAVRIYKQMKEEGVLPDLVMYNMLNFGLSKCGRVSEAKKFLKIIVELGQFADVVTYTSLMNGICREEDVFGAMALLEEMELKGCSSNSCTYNTLQRKNVE
ncbi:hypothetical protein Peur_029539 [Populus x canadensis]